MSDVVKHFKEAVESRPLMYFVAIVSSFVSISLTLVLRLNRDSLDPYAGLATLILALTTPLSVATMLWLWATKGPDPYRERDRDA